MSHSELRSDFNSVNVVVTTPFSEDGQHVNHEALAENVRFLREAGIRLYIPCGGTSEYSSLTDEERVNVVATTVDAVDGAGSVVAGVGGALKEALELVAEYEAVGADGIMVNPATHGSSHDALVEYYRTIANETDLGVMLYKTDSAISNDILAEVGELENILAIKYSDDVTDLTHTYDTLPENLVADLEWVNGRAEMHAVSFGLEGAHGFTTGIGNFVPEICLDLVEATKNGEWDRARQIREVVRPYQELRGEAGSIAAVKYGQELAGVTGGPVRIPRRGEMDQEHKDRANSYYESIMSATY